MKKILYITGFALIAGLLVTSCTKEEDENPFLNPDVKGAVVLVSNVVNGFFDLANPDASEIAFDVETKGETVSSILIKKSVNGGGEVDHATISAPTTVNVSFNDALSGTGSTAGDLEVGDVITLNFYVTTPSGTFKGGSLGVDLSCASALAGMYSVTTTYSQHDFLPDYSSNTMEMEIMDGSQAGLYIVNDMSGGLYSAGPYVDAYGTTDFVVEFKDVCNSISWEGQTDPWGPCVPTDGGVNSVDPATGVITLSWTCTAYGESGVSVYTPL